MLQLEDKMTCTRNGGGKPFNVKPMLKFSQTKDERSTASPFFLKTLLTAWPRWATA